MEFRVFPNYDTFIQRVPIDRKDHYIITDIHIPQNGAFWYTTSKKDIRRNINMNASFVHLYNGTKSIDELQFDYPPYKATRNNFKYDGEKKQLIIGGSILPWKSPKWVKSIIVSYTGSQIPKKKTKVQGDWILDRHERIIYLILDYAPIVWKNN